MEVGSHCEMSSAPVRTIDTNILWHCLGILLCPNFRLIIHDSVMATSAKSLNNSLILVYHFCILILAFSNVPTSHFLDFMCSDLVISYLYCYKWDEYLTLILGQPFWWLISLTCFIFIDWVSVDVIALDFKSMHATLCSLLMNWVQLVFVLSPFQ